MNYSEYGSNGDSLEQSEPNKNTSERLLFEINFEQISDQIRNRLRFPRIRPMQSLIDKLMQQNALILAGNPGLDKNDLAVYIAWELNHYIKHTNNNQPLNIFQWTRQCNPETLITHIRDLPKSNRAILLLPQISHRDFKRDYLYRIIDLATPYHYVIISTESSIDDWQLPEDARQLFWREFNPDSLFDPDDLAEALIERLLEKRRYLPREILIDDLAPNKPICKGITPKEIVKKLRTVSHIQWFVCSLCEFNQSINDDIINNFIKRACRSDTLSPDEAFLAWYHTLDHHSQLLALSVGILTNMYDRQFFAILDQLVSRVWRVRDPQLRAYDYNDLEKLEPFYTKISTASGEEIIQMQLPGDKQQIEQKWRSERQLLLKTAWNTQRRQIISVLPTLLQLVKNSVDTKSFNLELYGSPTHRRRLRQVIGETISDIGMIDISVVQNILIELASNNSTTVQLVAAKAMARWRYFDQHTLLFETLKRWRSNSQIHALFETASENSHVEERENGRTYVEATIAITVGVAAKYDKPNQLSPELVQLFRELSSNTKRFVRTRFRTHTLPYVIQHHLAQLRTELCSITRYVDLNRPIAECLAQTYYYRPKEVLRTLTQWYNECILNRPSVIDPEKLTLRETVMATIAMTYGKIDYSTPKNQITFSYAADQLMVILKEYQHPYVRYAVFTAVENLAESHFEEFEPHLHRLVRDLPEHERQDIINILLGIYARQRAEIQGNNDQVVVEKQPYHVWLPSATRPLTIVEQAMLRWMPNPKNPIALQMAFWALSDFESAIERIIKQAAYRQYEEQARAISTPKPPTTTITPITRPRTAEWLTRNIVPLLATGIEGRYYYQIIQHLLPEALERRKIDPIAQQDILARLDNISDQTIRAISKYLRRALRIVDRGWLAQGIMVMGLLALLCIGAQLATALLREALR